MKKISRRDFLKVTGLVGAAAALTACGGSASSTAASTASSAAGSAAASTAALGADTQAIVDRGVLKVGVKNAVQASASRIPSPASTRASRTASQR